MEKRRSFAVTVHINFVGMVWYGVWNHTSLRKESCKLIQSLCKCIYYLPGYCFKCNYDFMDCMTWHNKQLMDWCFQVRCYRQPWLINKLIVHICEIMVRIYGVCHCVNSNLFALFHTNKELMYMQWCESINEFICICLCSDSTRLNSYEALAK